MEEVKICRYCIFFDEYKCSKYGHCDKDHEQHEETDKACEEYLEFKGE